MRHIDLFSGIGSFAYAAQQIWGNEYENVFFCENNRFCQEVIKKNFGKDSVIYGDIREVTADTERRRYKQQNETICTGRASLVDGNKSIDLLTGGFPCQPFSCAGQRRGTSDDRYLWPEMFRVIKDFKPRWIIAENVRGLINIQDGVVFQQVCLDLEGEGYETQAFIIPSVAVNAPHRRDRVWIVAHALLKRPVGYDTKGVNSNASIQRCDKREEENNRPRKDEKIDRLVAEIGDVADTSTRNSQQRNDATQWSSKLLTAKRKTKSASIDGRCGNGRRTKTSGNNKNGNDAWNQDWFKIATKLCRMDAGLSAELDGFKLTKARHRVERLKALGNAIVPQVAVEIMRAIKYADENKDGTL